MSVIKGIKGVKDLLPEETPRWRFIEESARRWATRYGFHEIRIPIFEVTTLFARSIGASTDIVEKEMYTFQDRDGTSLTLRPEELPVLFGLMLSIIALRSQCLKNIFILGQCSATNAPGWPAEAVSPIRCGIVWNGGSSS